MTERVWLVYGEDYSGNTSYVLAAYTNEEMAVAHVEQAKKAIIHAVGWNGFDPLVPGGTTAIRYYAQWVPLVCHVDQFLEIGLAPIRQHARKQRKMSKKKYAEVE